MPKVLASPALIQRPVSHLLASQSITARVTRSCTAPVFQVHRVSFRDGQEVLYRLADTCTNSTCDNFPRAEAHLRGRKRAMTKVPDMLSRVEVSQIGSSGSGGAHSLIYLIVTSAR